MHVTYKTIPVRLLDTQAEGVFETKINQIIDGVEPDDIEILEDSKNFRWYDNTIWFHFDKDEKIHEGLHLDDDFYIVEIADDEDCTEITFTY